MAHQRESPVAVDDIALERSASDAHNKLLENREYCIIFRALAAHAELTQRLVAGACAAALRAPLARVDHLALLPISLDAPRLTATYGLLRPRMAPPTAEDGAWDQLETLGGAQALGQPARAALAAHATAFARATPLTSSMLQDQLSPPSADDGVTSSTAQKKQAKAAAKAKKGKKRKR